MRRAPRLPSAKQNLTKYRNNPIGFCREVLGVEPWAKQEAILASLAANRRTTVRACHYSGKTWAAACAAHWFTRCFNPALVISTAPTDRQVKEVLWKEIRGLHVQAGLSGILNRQDLTISSMQRAFGFTTSEPEKFQGWHEQNILVIVDEASGVDEAIYEAIEGVLTGPNARLLLIGNPNNPSGTFYESFRSDLYTAGRFHISAMEVPEHLLPKVWAEERRAEWGEETPMYQVRVLGEFPDQGEDCLIPLSWAEAAQEREGDETGPREVGVDVARFGSDESVACLRSGQRVHDLACWRGSDTQASAGRTAALARGMGAACIRVDDIGIGGGVTDRLRETLRGSTIRVEAVNVGEKPRDSEKFYNRRAELYWGLRERFKTGDISIPKDDILLSQLTTIRYGYTPRGQIQIESKDAMRKRRGSSAKWQSPDRADALMLAFATAGNAWAPVCLVGEGVNTTPRGIG